MPQVTIGTDSYDIEVLAYIAASGGLDFKISDLQFTAAQNATYRLHVCGDDYDFADAYDLDTGHRAWDIADPGPGWTEGLELSVALSAILSSDAALSDLALVDADGDPVALKAPFSPGLTGLSATVADTVSVVTVTATANDAGASFEYLGSGDAMLTDADTTTDGHQVNLAEGANTIKVKVTAEDGNATRTYTVTVTRAAAPTCDGDAVWCTTLVYADTPSGAGYCAYGAVLGECDYGSVGKDGFTLDGVDYTVRTVRNEDGGGLFLTLDREFPDADLSRLTLQAGSASFALADADRSTSPDAIANEYEWFGAATLNLFPVPTVNNWIAIQLLARDASTDATLSDLTLTNTADSMLVALNELFAAGTNTYTATVANAVDEITVAPTANDENAAIAYSVDDADGNAANGHQVKTAVRS